MRSAQVNDAPRALVSSKHSCTINAPAETVYKVLRHGALPLPWGVRALFTLRGVRVEGSLAFMERFGFVIVDDHEPTHLRLGAIGKFWSPVAELKPFEPGDFDRFAAPGFAKAALVFELAASPEGGTAVTTRTHVVATSPWAERKFRAYWLLVGLFSGWIRGQILATLKRECELRSEL